MSAGGICNRNVHTVRPRNTVRDAATRMLGHHVGTLVVVDDEQRPVGVITDRDIVTRCVAREFGPDGTTVEEIMSEPAKTAAVDAELPLVLDSMAESELRRLVVVDDDGRLFGILALDDVLKELVRELAPVGRLLESQIPV